jgi:hypothetical protein
MLSDILLSRLVPYIDEITGDHQCGFQRNRSTAVQIFCIRQIRDSTSAIYRFQESLRFRYTMYLNEAHNGVRIGKHLKDNLLTKMV